MANTKNISLISASDSSGRYRGQFFFGNDFWLGSVVFCDEVQSEADVRLGFYVATVSLAYPEYTKQVQYNIHQIYFLR